MIIDTHAHLWWPTYSSATAGEGYLDEVLRRARVAGVEKIIVPGTDLESSKNAIHLAQQYEGVIFAAVGIHPEELLKPGFGYKIRELRELIENNRKYVVAVGEVGMDLFTEELKEVIDQQKTMFSEMCELARNVRMPLIIHTRVCVEEVLTILSHFPEIKGQFHCFGGTEAEAREIIIKGYYMSFCGNVSWSKRVRRMSNLVPEDKLLLETDSPFMTPVNEYGEKVAEQNEPANVRISLQIIARERNMKIEELARQTTENAKRLYNL